MSTLSPRPISPKSTESPKPKPRLNLESILRRPRTPVTRESDDFQGSPRGSPRAFQKFQKPPKLDMRVIDPPSPTINEIDLTKTDLIQECEPVDLSPKTLHDLSKTFHPLAFLRIPSPDATSPLYPRTPEQSEEPEEPEEPLRRSKRVRPMTPKGEGAYVTQDKLSADLPSSLSFLFLHDVRFVSPEFVFRASGSGSDGDFDGLFLASEFKKYDSLLDHEFVGNALREAIKVYGTVRRNFSKGSTMGDNVFVKFHKVALCVLAADKRRRAQMGVAPPARYTGHAVHI